MMVTSEGAFCLNPSNIISSSTGVLCSCVVIINPCVSAASSNVGLDDFVEMTKKYAQGVAPPPVMAAAGDDDDDDDDVVVKNPDELPLQQKVGLVCPGRHRLSPS